jgi:hypothetical protein
LRGSRSPRRNSGGFQNISNYIKNIKPLPPLTLAALAVPEVQSLTPLGLPLTPHTMLSLLTLASLEEPEVSSSLTPPITKENNDTSSKSQDTSSNNLKIQRYSKENISSIIKSSHYYNTQDIPFAGDQINITSIYINIEKIKGVYFAKDANNVIFTLQDNLRNLYYYGDGGSGDAKASGGIYKISNNTRINMKGLSRFVFQSFNNDVDGILF